MNINEQIIRSKIMSAESLSQQLKSMRTDGGKIVFTNGCFDLVHLGHVDYLSKAAELGDFLVVGLNSDRSVERLKGQGRPLQDELSRAYLLASFFFVDAVVLFNEDTPYELIAKLEPDVLIKGSDYQLTDIVGADLVLARGGSVQTLDFVAGYSTSAIVKRIVENQ